MERPLQLNIPGGLRVHLNGARVAAVDRLVMASVARGLKSLSNSDRVLPTLGCRKCKDRP